MTWTHEAEQKIEELWLQGTCTAEIVKRLPVRKTRSAVIGKAQRMGLPLHGQGKNTGARVHATRMKGGGRAAAPLKKNLAPTFEAPPALDGIPGGVAFDDLERHHCRYALKELPYAQKGEGQRFCGAKRKPDSPYCEHHHSRCRRPYISKKDREAADRA